MSLLHYAPDHGWMNDPTDLVNWHGRHHMFFQYNPESTRFENQHWGHASSTDLLNWTEHPVALTPNEGRLTPYDVDGCWSGIAVKSGDAVTMLYTGLPAARLLRPAHLFVTPGEGRPFYRAE